METKRSLLILSFSPIERDARVLKEVRLFVGKYDVFTCGYGEAPEGVVDHFQISNAAVNWKYDNLSIVTHQYERAYWANAAVREAKSLLEGKTFDAILANDFDTAPLALHLKPRRGVHVDLHEYAPLEKENLKRWKWFITPFRSWVCRKYIARASSWTTVAQGIADKYREVFGFCPGVVTNAAPYQELTPTPVHSPLRLVHHGVAHSDRNLDRLAEAVSHTRLNCTLDFFLVPTDPAVIERLNKIAGRSGRIHLHEQLPYSEIVSTLNDFDCGIYTLPPVSFNNDHALPNKFFDFIQARLAVLIGPSPEMADYVERYELGAVAQDFSTEAFTALLDSIRPENVAVWKNTAAKAAVSLSAEEQVQGWAEAVGKLLNRG
ncbi:MAG: hypothetical protein SOS98_00310 [Varibaculum sp.]|nr:hypothetical protein [Varibaculum sp.]